MRKDELQELLQVLQELRPDDVARLKAAAKRLKAEEEKRRQAEALKAKLEYVEETLRQANLPNAVKVLEVEVDGTRFRVSHDEAGGMTVSPVQSRGISALGSKTEESRFWRECHLLGYKPKEVMDILGIPRYASYAERLRILEDAIERGLITKK